MIYHNSTDPVLIKKIPLRIWTLRDELEAVIQARLESGDYTKETRPSIDDLIAEYREKKPLVKATAAADDDNPLKLLEGGEDSEQDSSEDEPTESLEAADEGENDGEAEPAQEAKSKSAAEVVQRRPKLKEDRIFNGTLILSELEMDHMYFFTNKEFTVGQSIVVEFLIPKKFSVNIDVIYCRAFNLKSRIISNQNYRFRVAAKFTFLKEGERTLLRQFIQSIEPEVQKQAPPKIAKGKAEEVDDDFGDLDDLDI